MWKITFGFFKHKVYVYSIVSLAYASSEVSINPWVVPELLRPELFLPSPSELSIYGQYSLSEARLFAKPVDVPDDYIAYNPSGIWTVNDSGKNLDVMYVRVEPDRSSEGVSHLGKVVARPYIVDINNPDVPLNPYYDALEVSGEDPSLTRINRRLPVSGKLEAVWLLGVVDAQPKALIANEVESLETKFYAGKTLDKLEPVAVGPPWMKDIRILPSGTDDTRLQVWGRPQDKSFSGNITHTSVSGIDSLTSEVIANAPFINKHLLPVGSGIWGGVNDVVRVGPNRYILASHRAQRTGSDGTGRQYEAVLYSHDTSTQEIVDLGVIATADMFPLGKVKDDLLVDLHDVVFTGGGYNGQFSHLTFGVRDGTIGIGRVNRKAQLKAAA